MNPIVLCPISDLPASDLSKLGGGEGVWVVVQGQQRHLWLDDKADLPSFPLFSFSLSNLFCVWWKCFSLDTYLNASFAFMFGVRSRRSEFNSNDKLSIDMMVRQILLTSSLKDYLLSFHRSPHSTIPRLSHHETFPESSSVCLMTSWFGAVDQGWQLRNTKDGMIRPNLSFSVQFHALFWWQLRDISSQIQNTIHQAGPWWHFPLCIQ